jgi:hypothetical protein
MKLRSKILIIVCNSCPDSQSEFRDSHSGDGNVLQESFESVFVVHFGLCPPAAASTVESADQHKNNST